VRICNLISTLLGIVKDFVKQTLSKIIILLRIQSNKHNLSRSKHKIIVFWDQKHILTKLKYNKNSKGLIEIGLFLLHQIHMISSIVNKYKLNQQPGFRK